MNVRLTYGVIALTLAACAPEGVDPQLTAAAFDVPANEALAFDDGTSLIGQAATPPSFVMTLNAPFLYSGTSSISISGAPAGNTVRVAYSFNGVQNGPCLPFLNGNCLNIGGPVAPLPGFIPSSGLFDLPVNVPPAAPTPYIALQAIALPSGEVSNVVAFPIEQASSGVTTFSDIDGDGSTFLQGDCADNNGAIGPLMVDTTGDLIDQNCDGADGVDADGDGDPSAASGGTDCDDSDPTIYLDAPEFCNGLDNDCDGANDSSNGNPICPLPQTESFVSSTTATDILFVLDNSCSMSDEQLDLAAVAADLFQPIYDRGADLHVGVVTTDMVDPTQSGRLQAFNGSLFGDSTFQTDAGITAWFAGASIVGTAGDFTERGLAATGAALTPPLSTGDNAGFLRADAHLAVVHVTDEDDQSLLDPSFYAGGLAALKAGTPYTSQAFAVAGVPVTGGSCGAVDALRYEAFLNLLPGDFFDICGDFAPIAAALGPQIAAPLLDNVFPLSNAADPATLAVTLTDPATGASFTVQPGDLVYDAAANTVEVLAPIALGSEVDITYTTP